MSEIKISHIVAFNDDKVIGKGDNDLPWSIPSDLKRFRDLTMDHAVIMGRKTHFSIGRLLPKRKNVIVSRNPELIKKTGAVCSIDAAIAEAMQYATVKKQERIFVIGGSEIYERTNTIVDEIYATEVAGQHEGDRFYKMSDKMVKVEESPWQEENGQKFKYVLYKRA